MSVNRERPHLLILPEDDANREIVNGFLTNLHLQPDCITVPPVCGGWGKVLKKFQSTYIQYLQKYPNAHLVLLFDFDGKFESRIKDCNDMIRAEAPEQVCGRVYVLGSHNTPESLKRSTDRDFETIGKELAEECASGENTLWCHTDLRHNQPERKRLDKVVSFLFKQAN